MRINYLVLLKKIKNNKYKKIKYPKSKIKIYYLNKIKNYQIMNKMNKKYY